MSDLNENLLGRGKKGLQNKKKRFQECQKKIQAVRSKNNQLQRQCDNQIQGDFRATLQWQVTFLDNQTKQMQRSLELLSRDFKDTPSKKRIKELCDLASKQMERNKRIMAEFVNRTSLQTSSKKRSTVNPYRRSRTQFQKDLPPSRDTNLHPVQQKEDSSYMLSNDQLNDLKQEQKMMAERSKAIKQLQQKTTNIYNIINEMGDLVGGQQKDMVDKIGQNLDDVHHNMDDANENLSDAQKYQKKSKKKIIILAIVICVVVAIVAGVVFFITKS